MIEIYTFAGIAASLLLLLLLIGMKQEGGRGVAGAPEEAAPKREKSGAGPRIAEQRLFSREDQRYVERLNNPAILRLYKQERRQVALHWVKQTEQEVSAIMKRHRLMARSNPDLDARLEAVLLLRHLELQAICSVMICVIRIAGPRAVGDLAQFAASVSESIDKALREKNPAQHTV